MRALPDRRRASAPFPRSWRNSSWSPPASVPRTRSRPFRRVFAHGGAFARARDSRVRSGGGPSATSPAGPGPESPWIGSPSRSTTVPPNGPARSWTSSVPTAPGRRSSWSAVSPGSMPPSCTGSSPKATSSATTPGRTRRLPATATMITCARSSSERTMPLRRSSGRRHDVFAHRTSTSTAVSRRLRPLWACSIPRATWRRRHAGKRFDDLLEEHSERVIAEMWREGADAIGASMALLSPTLFEFRQGQAVARISLSTTPYHDLVSIRLAEDKPLAYRVLEQAQVPVPEHSVIDANDVASARALYERFAPPLVVKPVR